MSSYIVKHGNYKDFAIASKEIVASIYVGENEQPAVHRAVKDLQQDIHRVTGQSAPIQMDLEALKSEKEVIIIGTIGRDGIIDDFISKRLLQVGTLKDEMGTYRWEGNGVVCFLECTKNLFRE
ncbi:hypothetical protein [Paenibacillus sp. P36]|uniref:hypothetical protein n=1 Tax=Paenibacillus sp. P36 TaxID=3342538 RepID=UPI0038B39018